MRKIGLKESVRLAVTIAVGVVVVAGAADAEAQNREGRWELGLAALYQLGADLDFDGGSTVDTGDDLGFTVEAGYNFTDRVAVNFGLQWAGVDYDANVVEDDGDLLGVSGSYDQFALFGNLVYYLTDGALAPYVGAGLGWTWVDTNVPDGAPVTGCWWDPWYGYICSTTYPTKTTDAFSYQATVGVRYELNDTTFLKLTYTSQWMDFSNATSTPRFDVIGLEIGWVF